MKTIDSSKISINYNDQTGESIYFEDKEMKIPFTGKLVYKDKHGNVDEECEISNGHKTGVSIIYADPGIISDKSDYKCELKDGISREYYYNGGVEYFSIVIRNMFVKTLTLDENGKIIAIKEIASNEHGYQAIKNLLPNYQSLIDKYKEAKIGDYLINDEIIQF